MKDTREEKLSKSEKTELKRKKVTEQVMNLEAVLPT
jgi:hypothetical protein